MSRDDQRAVFLQIRGNGDVDDLVQGSDDTLDVPAMRQIDDRIAVRDEQVTRADHVRLAEEHHRVTVGVRIRNVDDLHAFVVEIDVPLGCRVRLRRPRALRGRLVLAVGAAHVIQHCLEGDDLCLIRRARADVADDIATRHSHARLRHRLVAASVVGMQVRVDDVSQRSVAEAPVGRNHLVRHRRDPGVDQ